MLRVMDVIIQALLDKDTNIGCQILAVAIRLLVGPC